MSLVLNPLRHASTLLQQAKKNATKWLLGHMVRVRHPTLLCDGTTIWNYPIREIDEALQLGRNVVVQANCEIIALPRTSNSGQRGKLILDDGAIISTGVNLRAAGGVIHIGAGSGIGQQCVVVAANHKAVAGMPYFHTSWDETRVGVSVGPNVWVGAGCVLLPGITIGENALIAAGSVVTKDVPANEVWGGVPARFLKHVSPAP